MSDAILQVFVFRDGEYVGSEIFPDGEVTLGRSDDADLVLEDMAIAPSQAVLRFDGQQATLLDLTQGDGTQINHTAIRHSYVTPRDEIHLGPFTLKLKFMSRNGSSRGLRGSSIPAAAAAGMAQSSGMGVSGERAEQLTEVLSTHPPTAQLLDTGGHRRDNSQRQQAVPTALVRSRDGERSQEIQAAIASEIGMDPGPTAGFDVGTSDVLSATASAPEPPRPTVSEPASKPGPFNPSQLEASSFEVMLDSAFMPSQPASVVDAARVESVRPALAETSSAMGVDEAHDLSTLAFEGSAPSSVPSLAPLPHQSSPLPHQSSPPAPLSHSPSPQAASPLPQALDVPPSQPMLRTPSRRVEPLAPLNDPLGPRTQPALPTGQPEDIDEEELDEEDRDAEERPGFRLLSQITSASTLERTDPRHTAVEVVAYTGQDLRSAHVLVETGEQYVLGRSVRGQRTPEADHRGLRLVRMTGPGTAEIEFSNAAQGQIRKHGRSAQLDGLKKPEHASGRHGERFRVALKTGMDAQLRLGDITFHVRFVRPPKAVPQLKTVRIEPFFVRAVGGAIGAHLFLGMLLVLLGPQTTFNSTGGEAYAEIIEQAPRDVEIKPEPPPPPPEPEVQTAPPPPAAEPPPKRRPKRRRRSRRRRPRQEQARGVTQQQVKTSGVLGAMGKLNLRAPGRRSMVQAASNLDAVKAPGGSNYRVGSLVGKTPTSNVRVGGGGGGKPLTRGSASLLKGGFGQLAGRQNGTVRGKVRRVSARRLEAKGSISREAVARVINENLGQVQYCYERALLKKPGLKGKLVLEWRISTSGRVSRVRQKMSSIASAQVATCIIRKLKTWRFPKPRGGVVVVSYPFIFSSVGF